ncbi:unnamed protein product [Parnassius apollo]|uniref:(apollo) hypothetical protein n=1 Tax=Parnassius apollo TaxID=110799 RepID=A0A8S3XAF0_PARAO|nr:unnamed protein product [Parnassius apollo]
MDSTDGKTIGFVKRQEWISEKEVTDLLISQRRSFNVNVTNMKKNLKMDKHDAKMEQNCEFSDGDSDSNEQVSRRPSRPSRTPATSSGAASSGSATASVPSGEVSARERNFRYLDERAQMPLRSLNQAYEGLLRVIPHDKNRTLSEEEIVTLAKNYINTLTNVFSSYGGDPFEFNDNDQL